MNYFRMTVYATVFAATSLISGIAVQAQTTVTAPTNSPAAAQTQEFKGAVDLLIEDLKNRNETVLRGCIEPCSDAEKSQKPQVTVGEAVDKVIPVYPAIAMAARASGNVVVSVVIDETGRVIAAQAVSGHPLLQSASVKAAKDSTFMPTLVGGTPVKVLATITYSFVMQ
jgi:TonB family protein